MITGQEKVTLRLLLDKLGLPFNFYIRTSNDLHDLLSAIERSKFGETMRARWTVDTNQIEIMASADGREPEELQDIITDVYEGFRAIEESREETLIISEDAKQLIKRILARIKKTATGRIEAAGHEPLFIETGEKLPLRRQKEQFSAWSSLDGRLDVISVRRQPYFVIYEHGTDHRVRCTFPDDWLDRVKNYLGYRVIVEGFIHYNRDGIPTSFSRPTAIERVPSPEQEDLGAYRGSMPGISGGLSSYEYVRQMRESVNG